MNEVTPDTIRKLKSIIQSRINEAKKHLEDLNSLKISGNRFNYYTWNESYYKGAVSKLKDILDVIGEVFNTEKGDEIEC